MHISQEYCLSHNIILETLRKKTNVHNLLSLCHTELLVKFLFLLKKYHYILMEIL
jgi:hypothetical protein